MKLTKKTAKLVCDLEYLIGSRCYNSNSYNGWTGDEGCDFRYPVWIDIGYTPKKMIVDDYGFVREDLNKCKIYGKAYTFHPEMRPKDASSLRYKFGSNELFIGAGIIDVLDFLEERYNIDFVELEKNLKKKN